MSDIDLTIDDFDEAIDYMVAMIGKDFAEAMELSVAILNDPAGFTGPQAAAAAIKMANYRYRIGVTAQLWKLKSSKQQTLRARLVKDALQVAYTSLEEVINTLKITARHDNELAK